MKILKISGVAIFFVVLLFSFASCQSETNQILFPVIYTDMDGTSLDSNEEFRKKTIEAFNKFKKCGGHVGLSTGRHYQQVAPYLSKVNPNLPIILLDGALAMSVDGKKVLKTNRMSQDVLDKLLKLEPDLEGVEGIYLYYPKTVDYVDKTERAKSFVKFLGLTPSSVCKDFKDCLAKAEKDPQRGIPLKIVFLVTKQNLDTNDKKIEKATDNSGYQYVIDNEWAIIDIAPKGTNKAVTIKAMIEDYGYTLDDVVYFGDNTNDVQMLSSVPLGIAMGNCRPDACQAATFVTGNHNTDAIGNVVERLVITQECK